MAITMAAMNNTTSRPPAEPTFDVAVAVHICLDIIPLLTDVKGGLEGLMAPGRLTQVGPAATATGGARVGVGVTVGVGVAVEVGVGGWAVSVGVGRKMENSRVPGSWQNTTHASAPCWRRSPVTCQ
jgi:hypothetical protein